MARSKTTAHFLLLLPVRSRYHAFPLHWAGLSDLTGRECSRSSVLEFLRPNYKEAYSKNLLKHLVLKHLF